MKDELIEVMPDASRIMEGLRDTGYEFNTAIADIVDNSIAADATIVAINVDQLFTGDIKVTIADNGHGMDRDELIDAMRYGAPQRKEKHSLGKFGLGLKTASTSCCRKLKVYTRKPEGCEGICATWDLDRIANDPERKWKLILSEPEHADIESLNAYAGSGTGTLVVWEKCDRILSARYRNPETRAYREALERIKESLRFHLSMTFQRFLDPNDDRARNVKILLGGKKVDAWDPFCRELVEGYGTEVFSVECEDGTSNITITPYIVPQKEDFASIEEKQRIMPAYKNDALRKFSEEAMSGFYVYRENRLIHWGE